MYKQYIEVPEQEEELIIDTAQKVGRDLAYKPNSSTSFEFLEHRFKVKAMKQIVNFKLHYVLVFADESELNNQGKPRISTAVSEVDCNLSEQEILRATVAAFLRNKCGHETVSELE